MPIPKIEFRASDLPADLPDMNCIVQRCATAGYRQNGAEIAVGDVPRFWIKYGISLSLGEALTQNQVARVVNTDPTSVVRVPEVYLVFSCERRRYIVMQYIAGDTVERRKPTPTTYAKGDVAAVAAAIKQLIGIRVPADTPPGHVGGGLIGHDFFRDCQATSEYRTVGDLQAQVNKLAAMQGYRVDYSGEIAQGLILCPSDIDPANFIVDLEGRLVVIDFGRTGYMPPSYVSYSLANPKPFTRRVARLVKYPQSANLLAMQVAAGYLVISGNNSLGVTPKSPLHSRKPSPRPSDQNRLSDTRRALPHERSQEPQGVGTVAPQVLPVE